MAISRKPKPHIAHDAHVAALISKGGTPSSTGNSEESVSCVVLRLPTEMLQQIDACVKARPIRIPRHTWLLEAIHEKLSREEALV